MAMRNKEIPTYNTHLAIYIFIRISPLLWPGTDAKVSLLRPLAKYNSLVSYSVCEQLASLSCEERVVQQASHSSYGT